MKQTGKPKPKPLDYDYWLECRNCGTVYPKHETKIEPELEPIKEPTESSRRPTIAVHNNKKRKAKGKR